MYLLGFCHDITTVVSVPSILGSSELFLDQAGQLLLDQVTMQSPCHKLFLDQAGQLLLDQVTMHKPRPWETSSAWRCQRVLEAFLIFYNQQEVKKPISFLTILFSGSRPASVLVRSIGNKLTNNLANLSRSIQ